MFNVKTYLLFILMTVIYACTTKNEQENVSTKFSQMLEQYYQKGLELDPMVAT